MPPTTHPSVEPYTVPLAQLQSQHPSKRLVIGAAIVSRSYANDGKGQNKILIVRRAPSESDFAGLYELPGGGAEEGVDATLVDTVVREVVEETGLRVTRVLGAFEGFEYETKGGRSVQFNFLVGVEPEGSEGDGVEVKLNPEEHDAFAWVAVGEIDEVGTKYALSGAMEGVVKGGLRALKELDGAI